MQRTFGEIQTEILTQLGLTASTVDATVLTSIKTRINQVQDYICFDRAWEWRKRRFFITTRPPYETGTISITQGSRTVTGSGTSWTDIMKMGFLVVGDRAYKIDHHSSVSSTSLKLVSGFPKDTISGEGYKIIYPHYFLDPSVSSILSVEHEQNKLALVNNNRIMMDRITVSEPTEASIAYQEFDFYTTGTVEMTNDSTTVTGSGTTFTSDMEGMPFRVNDYSDLSVINTFSSTTSISLSEAYQGSAGSGKSYTIGPKNSALLQLRNAPDNYYVIEVEALVAPPRLENSTDYSIIPNHAPLLHGAVWLALTDLQAKNPVRIQQAKSDFKETMQQLRDSYRVVGGDRWLRNEEIARQHLGSTFNPLDPRG